MADDLLFDLLIEISGSVGQYNYVDVRETANLLTHFHTMPAKRLYSFHRSVQPQEGNVDVPQ